jgi:hypothetical protein
LLKRDQDQVQAIKAVIPLQLTHMMQAIQMDPDLTLQTPFALKKNPHPLHPLAMKKPLPLVRNFNATQTLPTSWSLILRLAGVSTTRRHKVDVLKLDGQHALVKNLLNIAKLSLSLITLLSQCANAFALKSMIALSNYSTKIHVHAATKSATPTLLLQTLTLSANLVNVSAFKIAMI